MPKRKFIMCYHHTVIVNDDIYGKDTSDIGFITLAGNKGVMIIEPYVNHNSSDGDGTSTNINQHLLQDFDTLASNEFESIDRVVSNGWAYYHYQSTIGKIKFLAKKIIMGVYNWIDNKLNPVEIYGIERSKNNWIDPYVE